MLIDIGSLFLARFIRKKNDSDHRWRSREKIFRNHCYRVLNRLIYENMTFTYQKPYSNSYGIRKKTYLVLQLSN